MSDGNESQSPTETQVIVEKKTARDVSEWQVIQSDRAALMHEANVLVNHMIYKQVTPLLISGVGTMQELSGQEEATYKEALKFLQRQFFAGHTEAHRELTKTEREERND